MDIHMFCQIIDGELIIEGPHKYVGSINIYPISYQEYDTFFAINSKKYSNIDGGFGNTGNEDSVIGLGGTQNTHINIQEVISHGVKNIVYDEDIDIVLDEKKVNYIRVKDSVEALAKYARYILDYSNVRVIGITGSTGKTTLSSAIYDVLSDYYVVSKVNYIRTTFLGLIWHIINKLPKKCDFLIVEMQTDGQGQIDKYCNIVKVDYAFIVNVNSSHLARFGSQEKILHEKLGVYRGLKDSGKIFINIDNEKLASWYKEQSDSRIKTISLLEEADIVCYRTQRTNGKINLKLRYNGINSFENIEIKDNGKQSVLQTLFIISLLRDLKFVHNEIAVALTKVKPIVGRFQKFKGINDSLVIVDSYNASIDSTLYGIEYISNLKQRKKVLIIGSLLELGDNCEKIHRQIGKYINEKGEINYVLALGEATLYILDEIHIQKINYYHTFCYEEIIDYIKQLEIDGDTVIYIKGSGAMRMEIIALYLLSYLRN